METTERIVESYVRHVMGCATLPNVRCGSQNEIDLIAINLVTLDRYHIEVSISISQGFSKLTGHAFDPKKVKERVHQASQRRTVGFFVERKFNAPGVMERLGEFGFEPGTYSRVVVTWDWTDEAEAEAKAAGIELWDFREMVRKIADNVKTTRAYFSDDTLRTLHLFAAATEDAKRRAASRR